MTPWDPFLQEALVHLYCQPAPVNQEALAHLLLRLCLKHLDYQLCLEGPETNMRFIRTVNYYYVVCSVYRENVNTFLRCVLENLWARQILEDLLHHRFLVAPVVLVFLKVLPCQCHLLDQADPDYQLHRPFQVLPDTIKFINYYKIKIYKLQIYKC